jgi:HAD superfamily hydrolase (TIGR01549 family)
VISSQWVDGVHKYLINNHNIQSFFLITSTPQHEIEYILFQIGILEYFKKVIGSPTTKKEAVRMLLSSYKLDSSKTVMVGDSVTDYEAAVESNVTFLLRKTKLNIDLQNQLNCKMIDDFL